MKIANFIPHLSDGGAERVVSNNTINFSKEMEQKLIVLREEITYPFEAKLVKIKGNKKQLNLLKKELDICISHMPKCNILNVKTKTKECKVVITVHTILSEKFKNKPLHKMIIKRNYKKADLVVAVSKSVKEDLIRNFNIKEEKIYVFENCINIATLKKEQKNETFNLINVGRLIESKAQKRLIEIMSIVYKEDKNIKLKIYGDGPLKQELSEEILRYGLSENISLEGYSKNIFDEYKKSDVLISTSIIEGFGMSIVEAMSLGLPIISTNCAQGPKAIINANDKKYGILVDYSNGKDSNQKIAEYILRLSNDSVYYDKFKNLSIMRAKDFDIKIKIKDFEETLRRL